MIFKCVECGHIFEEGEEAEWYEDQGEFWGFPCREKMIGCPKCKGVFEEVQNCKKCGELHFEDELADGLCEACQEKENSDDNI